MNNICCGNKTRKNNNKVANLTNQKRSKSSHPRNDSQDTNSYEESSSREERGRVLNSIYPYILLYKTGNPLPLHKMNQ